MPWHNIAWFLVALCALFPQVLRFCKMRVFMGCARKLLLALALALFFCAASAFAQVSPTPTPPRLSVKVMLGQISGHSVIACFVKDSSGNPVASQTVAVQKSSTTTGPFANWMSKKTGVKGQALYPLAQPRNTWYVRCSAAGSVSATMRIPGKKPRPSPTATPRPTATATPRPTATATPRPTATPKADGPVTPRPSPTATPRPTATATPRPTPTPTPPDSLRRPLAIQRAN